MHPVLLHCVFKPVVLQIFFSGPPNLDKGVQVILRTVDVYFTCIPPQAPQWGNATREGETKNVNNASMSACHCPQRMATKECKLLHSLVSASACVSQCGHTSFLSMSPEFKSANFWSNMSHKSRTTMSSGAQQK